VIHLPGKKISAATEEVAAFFISAADCSE